MKNVPEFTVRVGDSTNLLQKVKPNYFSVCVTSPHYNIGKDYGNGFNDTQPFDKYFAGLKDVFLGVFRALKPDGLFFLNVGNSTKQRDGLGFMKAHLVAGQAINAGFKQVDEVIWTKAITVDTPDGKRINAGHFTPVKGNRLNPLFEYVFIFSKTENFKFNREKLFVPYTDKSNVGRYSEKDGRCIGDVWFIPYPTKGKTKKKNHKTEFPVELARRCIKLSGPGPVLDPFAGGGSVGVAAMKEGRESVLIDQNPAFCSRMELRLTKLNKKLRKRT